MRQERKEGLRDLAWAFGVGVPVAALAVWLAGAHTWWAPLLLGGLGGFIMGAPAVAMGLALQYDEWVDTYTTRRRLADASLYLFTFLLVPTWMVSKSDFFVAHEWPALFDVCMRVLATLPFAAFFVASLTLRAKPNEQIPAALRVALHVLWLSIQCLGALAPWLANSVKLTVVVAACAMLLPIAAIGWWLNRRRVSTTAK